MGVGCDNGMIVSAEKCREGGQMGNDLGDGKDDGRSENVLRFEI